MAGPARKRRPPVGEENAGPAGRIPACLSGKRIEISPALFRASPLFGARSGGCSQPLRPAQAFHSRVDVGRGGGLTAQAPSFEMPEESCPDVEAEAGRMESIKPEEQIDPSPKSFLQVG